MYASAHTRASTRSRVTQTLTSGNLFHASTHKIVCANAHTPRRARSRQRQFRRARVRIIMFFHTIGNEIFYRMKKQAGGRLTACLLLNRFNFFGIFYTDLFPYGIHPFHHTHRFCMRHERALCSSCIQRTDARLHFILVA